jgi:hypothetical protein
MQGARNSFCASSTDFFGSSCNQFGLVSLYVKGRKILSACSTLMVLLSFTCRYPKPICEQTRQYTDM